ncbi:MAG TPA: glycosyltransferase family A protein [Terriglobales bacterium]|nr:glycosyltransferase family A protein [Terriglobales bacterium]
MARSPLSVSVIIPTKNRPVDLENTVRSLLTQTAKPHELIIVDQTPGEESVLAIRRLYAEGFPDPQGDSHLIYLHEPSISGASVARSRAMEVASGEIWLFLDDDVILEKEFLEALVDTYQRYPAAAGVSGIITNYHPPILAFRAWSWLFARGPFHDDRQPIYWKAAKLGQREPIRVTRLGGGLMSFRMGSVQGVRFDENLTGASEGEDVDFCMHLGKNATLLIAPKARLFHKQSPAGRTGKHWLYLHARTNWYLYRRNWNHGLVNRMCFVWLNLGYGVAAALVSIHRRSLLPWAGLFKGVGQSRATVRGAAVSG